MRTGQKNVSSLIAKDGLFALNALEAFPPEVAALALTDHDAEAREALQRYLALPSTGPLKTIAAWTAHLESQHWVPAGVSERAYDGLRKAGMPEGEAKTN